MRDRKSKGKKFLVTNYDQCALTLKGTHPKLLSQPLVNFARENEFNGFYGISGRVYSLDLPNQTCNFLDWLTHMAAKKSRDSGLSVYSRNVIEKNYTTTQVTINLENASGLKCLAVSTGEDLVANRTCGDGFNEIIRPYEVDGIEPAGQPRNTDIRDLKKSKNLQLLQIAQHAAKRHLKAGKITLDYVDDNKACCESAIKASNDKRWPKNVLINVYHHANGQKKPAMMHEAEANKTKESIETKEAIETKAEPATKSHKTKKSAIIANSLFAPQTRQSARLKQVAETKRQARP